MSFKKVIVLILLAILALMELGDFVGNVTTALSAESFNTSQASLGISNMHQSLRLAFLLPASLLIAIFSIFVFIGSLTNSGMLRFTRMLTTVLFLMALFHIIATGFLLQSPFAAFGIFFLIAAILIRWLVPSAADPDLS